MQVKRYLIFEAIFELLLFVYRILFQKLDDTVQNDIVQNANMVQHIDENTPLNWSPDEETIYKKAKYLAKEAAVGKNNLWTQQFLPKCKSDFIENMGEYASLCTWLVGWKERLMRKPKIQSPGMELFDFYEFDN